VLQVDDLIETGAEQVVVARLLLLFRPHSNPPMEGFEGITNGPENESQIARKRRQNPGFLQIPLLQISQNVTQINSVRVLHGGRKIKPRQSGAS